MPQIDLCFVTEESFLNWKKQIIRSLGKSSELLPNGGSILDVEEATNEDIPVNLDFSFPPKTTFADARKTMIDESWMRSKARLNLPTGTPPPYDDLYLRRRKLTNVSNLLT